MFHKDNYENKYFKYKNKYLKLKQFLQKGGGNLSNLNNTEWEGKFFNIKFGTASGSGIGNDIDVTIQKKGKGVFQGRATYERVHNKFDRIKITIKNFEFSLKLDDFTQQMMINMDQGKSMAYYVPPVGAPAGAPAFVPPSPDVPLEVKVLPDIVTQITNYIKFQVNEFKPDLTKPIKTERVEMFRDTLNQSLTAHPYSDNVKVYGSTLGTSPSLPFPTITHNTEIIFSQYDTLVAHRKIMKIDSSSKIALVDFANIQSPGGTPQFGSPAQEEKIVYRTNLFLPIYSLFQINKDTSSPLHKLNQIPGISVNHFYPETGGVYIPNVTQFKEFEEEMKADQKSVVSFTPTKLNIIASAAFNYNTRGRTRHIPTRESGGPPNGVTKRSPKYEELTKAKMRAQLRIALLNGNNTIILGAFGSGAFDNPPELISQYYSNILKEPEFMNKFKRIIFAIYSPNPDRNDNYDIFRDQFIIAYNGLPNFSVIEIDTGGGGAAAAPPPVVSPPVVSPPVVSTTLKPQIGKTYNTIPNPKVYARSYVREGKIIPGSVKIQIIKNDRGRNPENGRWLYKTHTPRGIKIAWIDEKSIIT